jgi:hypothetical protein
MDSTESLVRERFEAAVGVVDLDVASLVTTGTVEGRRLQRRHRARVAGTAAMGVAIATTIGVLGASGVFIGSGSSGGPADGGPTTGQHNTGRLVPSTPQSLVAAVLAALPAGTVVDNYHAASKPRERGIIATLTITAPDGYHGQLVVTAKLPTRLPMACAATGNLIFCGDVRLPDGRRAFSSAFTGETLDVFVGVERRGVYVEERVAGARTLDEIPLSQRQMAEIAFNPLVGIRTSQLMVDRADALFRPGRQLPFTIGKAER